MRLAAIRRRRYLYQQILTSAVWLLSICVALASCRQAEPDRSYLEGRSCPAPCWQGITPGLTEEATALSVLSNPDLVLQDALDCQDDPSNPDNGRCRFRRVSGEGGSIAFESNTVSGISLKSTFELGEMIAAFGPPDFVNAMHGTQTKNDGKCYRANVYYLKGIRILVSGCEPIEFPLEIASQGNLVLFDEMQTIGLDFTPPGQELDTLLLTLFGDSELAQSDLINARPWEGYGEYPLPQLQEE